MEDNGQMQGQEETVSQETGSRDELDELEEFFPEAEGGKVEPEKEEAAEEQEKDETPEAGEAGPETAEESAREERTAEETPEEQDGHSKNIPRSRFDEVYRQWREEQGLTQRLIQENEQLKARLNRGTAEEPGGEAEAAELDGLREKLGDFPELAEYLDRSMQISRQREEQLKAELRELRGQIGPIRQSEAERSAAEHFAAIDRAHPDAASIIESREYAAWIKSQPGFVQKEYARVQQQGTASEVIDMFNAFKTQTGWGAEEKPEPKTDTRRAASIKRNIGESRRQPPAPRGAAGERAIRVSLPDSQDDYERLSESERMELLG